MFGAGFPVRREHKMINNQLSMVLKQFWQSCSPIGAFEKVFLVDSLPWHFAPPPAEFIAKPGKLFFPGEKIAPSLQPFLRRSDSVLLFHDWSSLVPSCSSDRHPLPQ